MHSLVDDAMHLASHLDFDGGYHIISERTARPPPLVNRPPTPTPASALADEEEDSRSSLSKHVRHSRQQSSLEGLLQNAARGVYVRGEQWGVNRAVRDAVGDVKKNVKGLRVGQPLAAENTDAGAHALAEDPKALLQTIDELQARNKALAKMLEGAANDLWKQQKAVVGDQSAETDQIRSFTMAIAKVQLAQVYLEDDSLPLPTEDLEIAEDRASSTTEPSQARSSVAATPNRVTPASRTARASSPSANLPEPTIATSHPPEKVASGRVDDSNESDATSYQRMKTNRTLRPSLQQSSFSWMLTPDSSQPNTSVRSAFVSANPFKPSTDPKAKTTQNLFGDEESTPAPRRGSKQGKKSKGLPEDEDKESNIPLGTWRGGSKDL